MEMMELFKMCKERNASDIHISAGSPPMLRVLGELEKIGEESLRKEDAHSMIYSFLNEDQKARFEKDRELDFSIEVPGIARFRVNIYSQRKGESGAFRLIPTQIKSVRELDLPLILESVAMESRGFFLVTGTTGCGKTTTLAAIIDLINQKKTNHVITIEDPIEYVHENKRCLIHQREIGVNTNSFYGALKNTLREDPDVILVGEMRDLETISMALTAAETGHLVFATLHTNSAAQTVNRIVDVFPGAQQQQIRTQLADTVLGILSQALLPKIDGTGRVCAAEVMMGTAAVRNLIREGKLHQLPSILQTGKRDGMQTMDQALEVLVNDGKITRDEAIKKAFNKEIFTRGALDFVSYGPGRR